MNKLNYLLSLIGCFLFSISLCFAQASFTPDSVLQQASMHKLISLYQQRAGTSASIYVGKEFVEYRMLIQGHQFFGEETWEKGSVLYDSLLYTDVRMKYDVVNAVVIVDHAQIAHPIKLESERVGSFSLQNHHFIRLIKDSLQITLPHTGFYDLVFIGKNLDLLTSRAKLLEDEIENHRVNYWFEDISRFYIRRDGNFYRVKSKKSVLKVLADKKKETKKYIKQQKLRFRQQTEEAILKTVQYYDQLQSSL